MAQKKLQLGFVVLVAMSAFSAGASARQRKNAAPPPRPPAAAPRNQPTPQERRMLDLPPKWLDRVQQMTPAQQERFLANNERFHSLSPQQQTQIRNRLQALNSVTPEQRQALLDREQVFQRLPADQQRYVKETLVPQWQAMLPRRRQVILGKLHDLRGLDDEQRAAKLNDESFTGNLNPNERQMLRDLSNLRVNPQEPPG